MENNNELHLSLGNNERELVSSRVKRQLWQCERTKEKRPLALPEDKRKKAQDRLMAQDWLMAQLSRFTRITSALVQPLTSTFRD